ncbi:MAG: MtrB/PioB family outer membrane beta-barrel protein, partial [Pseudomonadales bacterium]|nr:MtrB/PioB family outer membrane beta-barrel protein [Pseudomonadales bacterium]
LDASQGISKITDDLSPYTVNDSLTVTQPLPMTDIDDELNTRHLYVSVLTKPMRRATVNFKYRYEQRENTIPVLPWQYVRGDASDQPPALKAVFNQPHEIEKDQYTVEGSMRLSNGMRFTLGYDYNEVGRSFSAVDDTEEDVYRAEFKFRVADKVVTRIDYEYSDLAASTYDWNQAFFNTYTVEQINQIPDNQRFTNHPLLRQYHLATHTESRGGVNINWLVNDEWNVMLDFDYSDTDYDETELGLRSASNQLTNLSISYTPSDTFTSFLWFNISGNEMEQRGRAFRGGIEKPANDIYAPLAEGSDPDRNWDVTQDGENESLGAGFKWEVIENKFDIEADYVFVSTVIEDTIDVFGAQDLIGEDLPDIESDMHHFKLAGNYHVSKELTFRFHYDYYRFESEDWALDGVQLDTLSKVLTLGQKNPDETVNVFSVTALYRF